MSKKKKKIYAGSRIKFVLPWDEIIDPPTQEIRWRYGVFRRVEFISNDKFVCWVQEDETNKLYRISKYLVFKV